MKKMLDIFEFYLKSLKFNFMLFYQPNWKCVAPVICLFYGARIVEIELLDLVKRNLNMLVKKNGKEKTDLLVQDTVVFA